MIGLDDVIVLAMVALAVGYTGRYAWRRLRPGTPADSGCGACGGCDGAACRNWILHHTVGVLLSFGLRPPIG